MQRRLTITVSAEVYEALYREIGPRKLSGFIEQLVRPHVIPSELQARYAEMALEEARERVALEWSEALAEDAWDVPR